MSGFGPAGESLRVLSLRRPGFGAMWHHHDRFELNAILEGEGVRWIAGRSARFGPGDVVLVPPGVPHSWASDRPGRSGSSAAIVVLFSPDLLRVSFPELRRARSLLEDVKTTLCFDDFGGGVRATLQRLPRQTGAARLLGFLTCLDLLSSCTHRSLGGAASRADAGDRERALVHRAIALLYAAGREIPSQAQMAARLALSASRFSRVFRRGTALTYTAFVDARRIERACALLQRGELSVAQVAHAAGFDNLSNFNRRFRLAMSETPREYRRRFVLAMQ